MRFPVTAVSLGLLAFSLGAQAQDTGPTLRVSGFGTIGAVVTNTDEAAYQTGIQADGATTSASATPDTRLGLQLDSKFNNTFSATAQVLMRQNVKADYNPGIEWAFVKAKMGKDWNVRVGRMGAPFFATSDFRTVGYTNVSVRNPTEVYGLNPIRSFDGADVLYQGDINGVNVNAQLYAGNGRVLNSVNATGELYFLVKNLVGFSATAELGSFTFRAGTVQTKLDTEGGGEAGLKGYLGTLTRVGANPGLGSLLTLRDAITITDKAASFSGVGLTFDNGQWVVNSEYVVRKTDSVYVSDNNAWYLTAGYRVGKFTPYVSYAKRTTTSATSTAGVIGNVAFPPTVQPLISAANSTFVFDSSVSSAAIGSRWDLGKSFAIKGEIAQVMLPAGTAATNMFRSFKSPSGKFLSDTTVNVFSVLVDFVF